MKRYKLELWHPPFRGPADSALASGRDVAELLAGEWLVAHEGSMVRVQSRLTGRRWDARLLPDYSVRFIELVSDGVPDVSVAAHERRRMRAYVRQIERRERRLERRRSAAQVSADAQRRARADKFCRGFQRPVVCLDNFMPFGRVVDAARWVGVKQGSTLVLAIQRRRKCGGLRWQYADVLLQELHERRTNVHARRSLPTGGEDGDGPAVAAAAHAAGQDDAALRVAAEHAMRLSERAEVQGVLWKPRQVTPTREKMQ